MRLSGFMLAVLLAAGIASAQPAAQEQPPPPFAPAEVQKLLDGYAIIQAQDFLGMSDAQFAPFLPKLRALQETRRRNEQDRMRLLQELRRMTNGRGGNVSDNDIRDRLRALNELDVRAATDIQKAYESIDQSLDVRQQARFRLFEQEIERRKLQLLMRARQANQNRMNRPPQ